MIRKRISQSKGFAALSTQAQVVFCMLIPHYTPHGKMNGNPYFIKGEVMPFIKWATVPAIERCLKEISSHTSVKWFSIDGIWYLHSTNDQEHQTYQDGKIRKDVFPDFQPSKIQDNSSKHKLQSNSRVTPELLQTNSGGLPAINKKLELELELTTCAEMPKNGTSALPSELVLDFPCVGSPATWYLTQAKLAEYVDTYPGLDVARTCREARQWCRDNKRSQKTFGGMPAFLNRWLQKAQNNLPIRNGGSQVAADQQTKPKLVV